MWTYSKNKQKVKRVSKESRQNDGKNLSKTKSKTNLNPEKAQVIHH